jgi:hypothetical protein
MEEPARSYIGIFRIGDKATGSVTHVQVVEELTSACWPMAVADYVGRGILPRHDDLPWWQDWSSQSAGGGATVLTAVTSAGSARSTILGDADQR